MEINRALLQNFLIKNGYTVEELPKRIPQFLFATTTMPSTDSAMLSVIDLPAARESELSDAMRVLVIAQDGDSTGGIPAFCAVVRSEEKPQTFCDKLNLYIATLSEWIHTMSRLAEGKGICHEIIASSEPILGHYIGLSDALYSHVAHTPNIEPIDDMSKALCEDGRYPDEMLKLIERVALNQQWDRQYGSTPNPDGSLINPFPSVNRIIRRKGRYAAHIVMVSETVLSEGEIQLFDIMADKVEYCLQRQWSLSAQYVQPYSKFIEALMDGEMSEQKQVEEQAKMLKIETSGVFEICVISGAHKHGGLDHFARRIRTNVPKSMVILKGDDIHVLLRRGAGKERSIATMETYLIELTMSLDACMGISGKFEMLQWAHIANRQAQIALKYGKKNCHIYDVLSAREPDLNHVFRFKRYFPCYVADPESDSADFLNEFRNSPNTITRLRDADIANGTNDFSLLRVYLFCDGNIKETASLMNMHRNTVSYRLNKIQKDFRLDLEDGDTRLFLHFIFAVID